MRLFARVLCLEGYDDLAADATESLGRLIALLGDPGDDDGVGDDEKSEETAAAEKPSKPKA
jgi:hypothetical protein